MRICLKKQANKQAQTAINKTAEWHGFEKGCSEATNDLPSQGLHLAVCCHLGCCCASSMFSIAKESKVLTFKKEVLKNDRDKMGISVDCLWKPIAHGACAYT